MNSRHDAQAVDLGCGSKANTPTPRQRLDLLCPKGTFFWLHLLGIAYTRQVLRYSWIRRQNQSRSRHRSGQGAATSFVNSGQAANACRPQILLNFQVWFEG
jgi:hypothetical protein